MPMDHEDEPVPFVPWADRYAEAQRLRRELGAHGFTQAYMCAMTEYDPDVRVKVTFTRTRKRRATRKQ